MQKVGTLRSAGSNCPALGLGGVFNALIFGNFEAHGGDTDARLAVAGNANIPGGYSVGHVINGDPLPIFTDGETDIYIVQGDLHEGNFGVNGNIVHGGVRHGPQRWMSYNNLVRQVDLITFDEDGNVPDDGSGVTFEQLQAEMEIRSAVLGALEDRGVVEKDASLGYVITLTGDDPELNVFNLSAEEWSVSSAGINITVPSGSTVLVNIHGESVEISGVGMTLDGVSPREVLFNYVNATSLTTSGFAQRGSVLAPYASAHLIGGSIDGTAILGGDVLTENGFEFHNWPFLGGICVEVLYEFTVTNTGSIPLSEIQIEDPLVVVEGGPVDLAEGKTDATNFTAVYAFNPIDFVDGQLINTATVTAQLPDGDQISATASHTLVLEAASTGIPIAPADPDDPSDPDDPGDPGDPSEPSDPSDASDPADPDHITQPWMKPDFTIQSVQVDPQPQITGDTFNVTVKIGNSGNIPGNAGILALWTSAPSWYDLPGEPDHTLDVGAVNVGETVTKVFEDVSASTVAGGFFARVVVNNDQTTDEHSFGNNHGGSHYTVQNPGPAPWMKPDFVIKTIELAPKPSLTGASFTATVRVLNQGDIPGDAGNLALWSRAPSWHDLSADADHVVAVGEMEVGDVAEFVFENLTAPNNQGTFFTRAVVNVDQTTDEKSFGNNHGGASYTVTEIQVKTKVLSDGSIKLTWNSAGGHTFTVERSTDLSSGFSPIETGIEATPPKNTHTDDNPPSGPVFYRVKGYVP